MGLPIALDDPSPNQGTRWLKGGPSPAPVTGQPAAEPYWTKPYLPSRGTCDARAPPVNSQGQPGVPLSLSHSSPSPTSCPSIHPPSIHPASFAHTPCSQQPASSQPAPSPSLPLSLRLPSIHPSIHLAIFPSVRPSSAPPWEARIAGIAVVVMHPHRYDTRGREDEGR